MTTQVNNIQRGNVPTSFAGRVAPWHQVWKQIESNNLQDAMRLADLDWETVKTPFINPHTGMPSQEAFGTFRSDNHAEIGRVGREYVPHNNSHIFGFLTDLIGQGYTIDSMGHLHNGSIVFANMLTSEKEVVKDDVHKLYFQLTSSHNGSLATELFNTDIRMVCGNTVRHAMDAAKEKLKFYHTANGEVRLKEASELLTIVGKSQDSFIEKLRFLAQVQVDSTFLESFLNKMLGDSLNDEGKEKTRTLNMKAEITALFESNDNNTIKVIRGSAYNLLNAVTEAYDHSSIFVANKNNGYNRDEAKAVSASFGNFATKKTDAMNLISKMANSKANNTLNLSI